ncbi:sodium:proton antiporter [Marinithermofilum abyssi]|uniref:Sodium:proton antiporter n=1 Tax=Marinithermofilum abyssi TaxID=1571185 RepID=A0A8J2VHT7_9BACL|nr:cation:proton antiporter [Marinithermofilum abyssi]GGE26581.1 sodium:proton antiporter [Marinithermofilum abyssi]
MESQAMTVVQSELYVLFMVLTVGLLAMKAAERWNIPDVALFLLFGILIGPPVFSLISQPESSVAYQFIIVAGSVLILFEGGQAIRISILKQVWISVTLLAVLGVAITAAVITVTAVFLLHLPWLYALLLASVIASTDPATLIPVFRQVHVQEKVRRTVESESAFNDATASILTFTLLGVILGKSSVSAGSVLGSFLLQAGGGLLIGILFGGAGLLLTSKHRLGVFHRYGNIVSLLVAIGSYLAAGWIEASGFMATFVAGIVCGNPQVFGMKIRRKTVSDVIHFHHVFTLLMRTLIFVLLGTQVEFDTLLRYGWQAILIVMALIFIARPIAVLACTLPDRRAKWSWREIFFMFWVRETGVIPAALSGMLIGLKVQHAHLIAAVTFMAVLITIVLQAGTTGLVAKVLGVTEKKQ